MMAGQGVPLSTQPTPTETGSRRKWGRVRAAGSQISESTKTAMAQQRPWSQLLDRGAFTRPDSIAEASSRIKQNLNYFRMNYLFFVLVVSVLSLLWQPLSLIPLLVLLAAWIFLYFSRTEPLVVFNRSFGDNEILIALGIATLLVIFLTNIGSTLLSAVAHAAAIIAIHAAFRNPDDLYLEEDGNATASFLNYSGPPPPTRLNSVI